MSDLLATFTAARRRWGGNGPGSSEKNTATLVRELPALFERWKVRRVVDLGCGDVSWVAPIAATLDLYVGVDVVPSVEEENRRKFQSLRFATIKDHKAELEACDLVICRDCIAHLASAQIHGLLAQVARAAPLALITNYPSSRANEDVTPGGFRPVNLIARPFYLPEPIELVNDSDRKVMGLWRTSTFKPFQVNR